MTTKCPQCGHENPPETLFCEECDWRLDLKYKPEKQRNPILLPAVTAILGIIAVACGFITGAEIGAVACGGIGMVVGGYSVSAAKLTGGSNAVIALGGVGLILGVIGFLFGFSIIVGAI